MVDNADLRTRYEELATLPATASARRKRERGRAFERLLHAYSTKKDSIRERTIAQQAKRCCRLEGRESDGAAPGGPGAPPRRPAGRQLREVAALAADVEKRYEASEARQQPDYGCEELQHPLSFRVHRSSFLAVS